MELTNRTRCSRNCKQDRATNNAEGTCNLQCNRQQEAKSIGLGEELGGDGEALRVFKQDSTYDSTCLLERSH